MDRRGWGGAYLGFLPFLAFPPPFFPVFVPFFTSCIASGCAAVLLGSSWCFFWRLLAWLTALACGWAYGLGCGRCAKPCRRCMYGVASIGRGVWCGVWWWCGRWWWEGRSDVATFEPQLPHLGWHRPWAMSVGYILLSYSDNNACIAHWL